jgi:hypothetical protein
MRTPANKAKTTAAMMLVNMLNLNCKTTPQQKKPTQQTTSSDRLRRLTH